MHGAAPVDLTLLANKYRSDKGTQEGHAHHYTQLYSFVFEQFRAEKFSMLEIGLLRGGVEAGAGVDRVAHDVPSIRMWLDFFPQAHVYGFDLSDFSSISLERFTFLRGDLSSPRNMIDLSDGLPPLRIIVDDGSHASFHQQLALTTLFDKIEPGGFYVIEDFHWQPPFEKDLPPCRKSSEIFEEYLQTGVFRIDFVPAAASEALSSRFGHVFIHRNNRGGISDWRMKMVAIQKK